MKCPIYQIDQLYELVYLLEKLTRMNLYMFIARTAAFQFTNQYQWSEKCNIINLRGCSFYGCFFFDLPSFFPKMYRIVHNKNHCIFQLQKNSYLPGNKQSWKIHSVNVLSSVSLFSVLRTELHIGRVGQGPTRFVKS